MELKMNISYHVTLTNEELRLVVAALYGGLKADQLEAALALQKRLVESRAQQASQMAKAHAAYARNLEDRPAEMERGS